MHKTAIVIPAFNEAKTIRKIAKAALRYASLVIIVDDCSTDATLEQVKDLPVTTIQHTQNLGKAAALNSGFKLALGKDIDQVLCMDADGQHDPKEILNFLNAAEEYPQQIILGSRSLNTEHAPRSRYIANRVADFWISWAAGTMLKDSQSGYRLIPRKALEQVCKKMSRSKGFVFESEFLINAAWLDFRIHSIEIESIYKDTLRKSHFKPVRDISAIVIMVAKKLLITGFNLPGLWRILKPKQNQTKTKEREYAN